MKAYDEGQIIAIENQRENGKRKVQLKNLSPLLWASVNNLAIFVSWTYNNLVILKLCAIFPVSYRGSHKMKVLQ